MNETIKPCPCGQTPSRITPTAESNNPKYAHAVPDCCGTWEIEYRNGCHAVDSPIAMKKALDAWNEAPRKAEPKKEFHREFVYVEKRMPITQAVAVCQENGYAVVLKEVYLSYEEALTEHSKHEAELNNRIMQLLQEKSQAIDALRGWMNRERMCVGLTLRAIIDQYENQ